MRNCSSPLDMSRREFGLQTAVSIGAMALAGVKPSTIRADENGSEFSLNYILGSPMYGTAPLDEVLGEAPKIGTRTIDIWPRNHANHREQMDQLGFENVQDLLEKHNVQLGVITRYDLGPQRIHSEIPVLSRFGGKLLVCGAGMSAGDTEKERVQNFLKQLRPQLVEAEKRNVTIGIENHAGTLLSSPDSLRYFADHIESEHVGLALAPYHLPQDPQMIGDLIEHFASKLVFFQAWQHGMGCAKKLPKKEELLQLPGRGPLDFCPIIAALRRINYQGWTEIFMHPVPRGIPILPKTAEVTTEINRARSYLETCL